ncbi:hypothetical protein [Serratia fonticola]|uniref:hypothetical protein n=1 Tax=Serratia fonticola TaxID=47917 RepID=UPI000939B635|nr:hypothetical protein [Serratia fonticola]OKP30977.1 hypothetical protein BSQ40_03395 [Serratia fonticola]CAI1073979.1 Uncharacterised protein [Serratia fonticola]
MKKLLLTMLMVASFFATAKEYTKEQLNSLVEAGNYPDQGVPQTLADEVVDFSQCREIGRSTLNSVSSYPTRVLTDTSLIYSIKIWANDGVVFMTCTNADNRSVVKKSFYK